MSSIKLAAKTRTAIGKKNKELRDGNTIPAVVYGPKSDNQNITLDLKNFMKTFHQSGTSAIIDLSIDGKDAVPVLVHDFQKDPLRDDFIHVDFYQLDMDKKLTVDVDLVLENAADIEKNSGGEIIKTMDTLKVNCSPKNLIKEITVVLSRYLEKIGDTFRAKDVPLPEGLELIVDGEEPIASLHEIKEEIIEAPVEEEKETEGEEEKKKGEEKDEEKKEGGEEKPAESENKK